MRWWIPVLLAAVMAPLNAEVVKRSSHGFVVSHTRTVPVDPGPAFERLTSGLPGWWSPAHSFSGDAANFRIDRDCFCEAWEDNLVRHLDVVAWRPGSQVVFEGGLGPLKGIGLTGTMVWSLSAAEGGEGTRVEWTYFVRGFTTADVHVLADAVDGVLAEQIERYAGSFGDR